MRRYSRTLILIAVLVVAALLALSFKTINIGGFERGEDTLLGLSLGLDLQGGSHLVYQAVDSETGEPISPGEDQMEALKRSIERRVNASGLGEPIIQLLGDDRLLVQLPGVGDPERAKSLIGETAQLVFKHRMLNVPRELPEDISDDDIVSIRVDTFPTEEEIEALMSTSTSTSTPVEAAAPEGQEAEGEAEGESESQEAEGEAEGESESQEAEGEAEGESESQEAEGEAEGESESQEAEGEAAGEGEGEAAGEGESEAAEGEEASEGESEEAEDQGPPLLIVEFTEEGAEKFAQVEDRLTETFLASASVDANSRLIPNRLDISVEGAESIRFEVTTLSVQRVASTTLFAFAFPQGVAGGRLTDVESGQAMLGDDPTIRFTEIQGKVDEDIREGSLTGEDLARAYAGQHSGSGVPIVNIEFKDRGTRIFGELTTRIAGSTQDQIAILLDDEELISPVVQSPITSGTSIIQGSQFTIQRVRDLALLLESGRLPVPIELVQERDVDAILGADSLRKSVIAGLIGLALVMLFMTLYYRLPGGVASVALLIYALMVLAVFKILPITLTLSGVAALILSIGMAVDANILIFERMKEELRAGRTLLSAINIGFNRAWPAIRDGNVSTLITCGILFWFSDRLGATVIQGFAVALAVGVLLSMFSAITMSRTFLRVIALTAMTRRLGLFVPIGAAELPQQRQQAVAPVAQRS